MPRFGSWQRWWGAVLAVGLLLPQSPGRAVSAVLIESAPTTLTWRLAEPVPWRPPLRLDAAGGQVELVLVRVNGLEAVTQVVRWDAAVRRTVGDRVELSAGGPATSPAPLAVSAGSGGAGTVIEVAGERAVVRLAQPPMPGAGAAAVRAGQVVADLEWPDAGQPGCWAATWKGRGDNVLNPGDRITFAAAAAAALDTTVPAAKPQGPKRETRDQETLVPADDPIYPLLASLAARGVIPQASYRQFAGPAQAVYTRKQIVDFLETTLSHLSGLTRTWRDAIEPADAARLHRALDTYGAELEARGFPMREVDAALRERGGGHQAWVLTGQAAGRVQTGDPHAVGQLRGTLLFRHSEHFRSGLTVGTEGGESLTPWQDRDDLPMWFLEGDIGRHATLRVGRLATRFDPGFNSLLWSDHARPVDGLYYHWHNKVFGRPFDYSQLNGYMRDGGSDKFIAVQNYEYLPVSKLALGAHFALITDKAGQGLASLFVPAYLARFVSGPFSKGGSGNFLGSANISYRWSRELATYGSFFVDEFDFNPKRAGRTPQRIGWSGGVQYTPAWALPGTSYRFEGTIIPGRGAYVGQNQPQLRWLRDGMVLGHPYAEDSAGFLFDLRQRVTPRVDVSARYEQFRQRRSYPVPVQNTYLDLAARYDLRSWLGLGVGYRHRRINSPGGVAGTRFDESVWYFEGTTGY
ncbi:MAG: hypothetical protein HYU66_03795 [Armatimonadetes bacterium]|nr:hypothetical protein [Armatimonadota bacterium]